MLPQSIIFIAAIQLVSLFAAYPLAAGEKESDLVQAQTAPPEASLLDVGILVFDPGLPDDAKGLRKLEAMGIFEEVRRSEALYVPVHLKRTLQKAGFWGTVRLVPSASVLDVTVSGTISSSSSGELQLNIRAVDSRGKVWLDKRYKGKADASVYLRREKTHEPFQQLYNQIANDILSKRKKLGEKDLKTIRYDFAAPVRSGSGAGRIFGLSRDEQEDSLLRRATTGPGRSHGGSRGAPASARRNRRSTNPPRR